MVGLTDDDSVDSTETVNVKSVREHEIMEACGVNEDLLRVHGVVPGTKADGVTRGTM